MSTEDYIDILAEGQILRERLLRAAIRTLRPPRGSRGLDVGCGIGLQAIPLARAAGPGGRVTGLDLSPEHLAYARRLVAKAGLARRISFEVGDARRLPFREGAFDWAWSVDCVGYAPIEPLRMVSELVRVVRPGGTVAILAWSSQMLLPGYPVLEARLNATAAGIGPFRAGDRPDTHYTRALGLLREAGLVDLRVETLAAGVHAPLSGRQRRAWTALLEMRWAGAEAELEPADAAEVRRLCLAGSPDYIVDHPEYYGFFTYSMFMGTVTGVR